MHHLLVSKGPHVRWWSCEMIRELKTSCLLGRITAVLTAELKTSCLLVASQRIVHVFVAVQEHSTRSRAQCVAPAASLVCAFPALCFVSLFESALFPLP